MPVPIVCHNCHSGRYGALGPDSYACQSCGSRAAESAFPVHSNERLMVIESVLQVLSVPDGHQVITPTRRCYAPHLSASLTLALRLNRTHPVFRHAEETTAAEDLLTVLDTDERGPWVLSPVEQRVLLRAMDVRCALVPSASRQHPEFDAEIRTACALRRRPSGT
ncbi:hypothetical protein ACSHXN_43915 (plasmid) [Streptomyces sp. HUAS TT11]|uniref:hypothetical protein n=1 Tax=Streptomyces sp. HUAS TT11 TaxID=3447508 RepID=UPI003F65A756